MRASRKRQQITGLRHAQRFASQGPSQHHLGCEDGRPARWVPTSNLRRRPRSPHSRPRLCKPRLSEARRKRPTFMVSTFLSDWWELLRCPPRNTKLARPTDANADLEAATAAVRIAVTNTRAAQGTFAPQVSASLGPTWQKQSAAQAKLSGGAPHPIQFSRRRFPYPILPMSLASIVARSSRWPREQRRSTSSSRRPIDVGASAAAIAKLANI